MALALVAVLADQAGQAQIGNGQCQAKFLLRFSARTRVGRFAFVLMQFSATRTPKSKIRFLRPLQQQYLVFLVKAVKQGGDLIRQRHGPSKDWKDGHDKSARPVERELKGKRIIRNFRGEFQA